MRTILGLAVGGAVGTLARWAGTLALLPAGERLPWGTLTVNLSGCFAAGFLDSAAARRGWSANTRTLLLTGLCGGFTTFSALVLQLDVLLRSRPWAGFAYAALSLAGGLVLLRLGSALGR